MVKSEGFISLAQKLTEFWPFEVGKWNWMGRNSSFRMCKCDIFRGPDFFAFKLKLCTEMIFFQCITSKFSDLKQKWL